MKSLFRNMTVFQSTSTFLNKGYEIRLTPPPPFVKKFHKIPLFFRRWLPLPDDHIDDQDEVFSDHQYHHHYHDDINHQDKIDGCNNNDDASLDVSHSHGFGLRL